jgi:hypothetical protein
MQVKATVSFLGALSYEGVSGNGNTLLGILYFSSSRRGVVNFKPISLHPWRNG